ncbi:LPXTG cell wall anchor domain-containing protein [Priestia filamentosa]|uniref:LPXTG cell wall anchor domain-containing protein n=1 Tax=Priestia filamentosa TaxID=1402861 RepID=UPI00069EE283|nr:LPXTG cell wall anchor domain-containing protein [Priestia filamentosa]
MKNLKKLCAGIMACGFVLGVGNVTTQAAPSDDKNCIDFKGDKQALMDFWYQNGYNANNDPHDLDRDNDGLPCETTKGEWDQYVAEKEEAKKEDSATEETTKQEESTSTTPATTEEKSDDDKQSTVTTTKEESTETKEQGEALPNTATNDVAMMGLAGLMAAAGGVLMFKRRKK